MTTGVNIIIFTDTANKLFLRPAGAYKIATVLRQHGLTVQVIDHFLLAGLNKTLELLGKFVGTETLFVGFSTTFMNVTPEHIDISISDKSMFGYEGLALRQTGSIFEGHTEGIPISNVELDRIAEYIKKINPSTKIVMGGTKANYCNQRQIDAFIVGFADDAVVQYVKFLQGKNTFFQYKKINDTQILIDHDMTGADHDFINSCIRFTESDFIRKGEILPIELSRGCMFKCKFCYHPMTGRKKNDYIRLDSVLYDEFMYNYEKFGTTKYIFADDTYNESVQKLEFMRSVYERLPFKIEYCTYLRLDLIHRYPEMADLLKDSGLKVAMFGIETLNYEAAKIIGKGLHPEKIKETLHWLRYDKGWKDNILTSSGFIVGLPTENYDTVSKWAEELLDFKYPLDTYNFHALRLYPDDSRFWKSEFEKNYKDYGYYFDPAKSVGWINENWRQEEAVNMAIKLHGYGMDAGVSKLNGNGIAMLQNYGLSWNKAMSTTWAHLSYNRNFFSETRQLAKDYFGNLLTL